MGVSARLRCAREIAEKLGLPASFPETLLEENASNLLPYHNNEHAYAVATQAVMLGYYRENPLPKEDLLNLFLAGLLHDYNHTGDPTQADSANIELALAAVEINHRYTIPKVGGDVEVVAHLIKATDTTRVEAPVSLLERILCDADILEWCVCSKDRFYELTAGLSLEKNMVVTRESTTKFILSHGFHTPEAQKHMYDNQMMYPAGDDEFDAQWYHLHPL